MPNNIKISSSSEILAVFFDAAGTLFEVRGKVGEVYADFAARYGLKVDSEEIHRSFLKNFRSQPPMAFEPGLQPGLQEDQLKLREFGWWKNLVKDVFAGCDFPRFDQFFYDLFEHFRSKDAWRLFDDVVPALENLKRRELRLAIISNFDSRLEDLIEQFELGGFFDAVHLSTRVGAAKPDPMIFYAALKKFGIRPEEALHIGDSLSEDYEGAKAVGINAALLDRKGGNAENAIDSLARIDLILSNRNFIKRR